MVSKSTCLTVGCADLLPGYGRVGLLPIVFTIELDDIMGELMKSNGENDVKILRSFVFGVFA